MIVPTTRIAGITVLFVRGLDPVLATAAMFIGDGDWTKECIQAVASLPQKQRPLTTHFGGGEDHMGLRTSVTRALEQADAFRANAVFMPMPRTKRDWTMDMFAYIIEAISRHGERFGNHGHLGLVTIVFPADTNPLILSDFATLANQR